MDMLSSESEATYSFQGMKRRLGLHQEKLTRILKRLEDDNLVMKTDEGYRALRQNRKHLRRMAYGEPVIRGQIPPAMDPVSLMVRLKGRWFKNFRWLGSANGEMGQSLYWITEDGSFQVRVQFTASEILVWSKATDTAQTMSPVAAGYELFDRISRIVPETGAYS